jgi:PAS domain S-box-containing protein
MADEKKQDMVQALGVLAPMLDATDNGVVIIDERGVVLIYNRAAAAMLVPEVEPAVGRHLREVRPEGWRDLKTILETGQPQIGARIKFPSATIVANRNPILVEGRVAGVISVFQDISHYERIISELQGYKKLHRELEAIFETSRDGMYITNGAANTIRVNSAYEGITGLKRENLIGRNMRELVADQVLDKSVTLDVIKKGISLTIMQNITGGKQVMVTGNPVFDEEGNIVLVVTNVRDMTSLNQLRGQLEESRLLSARYHQSLFELEQFEHVLQDMVVKSSVMVRVVQKAVKAAAVEAVVLLSGESGVGKSMLARIIHQLSPRREGPFVKINCGAIPEALMESELFGYAKGAFTGASPAGKAGLIEAGHGGTVFLDEVAELTPAMQVKLLEVTGEHTFTRVGATGPTKVDVRIIAATNRDLKALVAEGGFREDLYYRLNVVPINLPPLRRRREDIPELCLSLLAHSKQVPGGKKRLEPEVLDALMLYDYPGNVRELLNIVERMAIMSEGETITLADLPGELKLPGPAGQTLGPGQGLKEAVAALEAQVIQGALERHQHLSQVARALGVHPSTLWRKMVKYGLQS